MTTRSKRDIAADLRRDPSTVDRYALLSEGLAALLDPPAPETSILGHTLREWEAMDLRPSEAARVRRIFFAVTNTTRGHDTLTQADIEFLHKTYNAARSSGA